MKQETAEVLNLDVQKLTEMLNQALAEEWLAYYQYWVGARVMEGPMRIPIEAELLEHANEELKHAEMLIERIIQLGGTPVLNPLQWQEMARCKYETPTDPYIETILEQNLRSERCAIKPAAWITRRRKWRWIFSRTSSNTRTISFRSRTTSSR